MNMHFQELTNNLEAMLHESMVKIGYVKGEPVGIYYTEDLMHHLLGLNENSTEQTVPIGQHILGKDEVTERAMQLLEAFCQEKEPEWGKLQIDKRKARYQVIVPAKGMEFVYQRNRNNHFLEDLIGVLRLPEVTIEHVVEVFHRYSNEVICEKSEDEEFEYAVHFADPSIDPFIYCFTFDEMGQYYHRFTEYDYRKLIESDDH